MSVQKIAVAVIHGMGSGDLDVDAGNLEQPKYFSRLSRQIIERFAQQLGISPEEAESRLVFEYIYWAPLLQPEQRELWEKVKGENLRFEWLRFFFINVLGDTIAYQVTSERDRSLYDGIHGRVAESLRTLAEKAGPTAPLCTIAHSLGTVIASNYFYDLQEFTRTRGSKVLMPESVTSQMGNTPLERGETLTLFYTLGSPIALWSLHQKFDRPIQVPAQQLSTYHPDLVGEWVNFYDPNDIIAYPLKSLSPEYEQVVTTDWPVNVGNFLTSWNPLSHVAYWSDRFITGAVGEALASTWKVVNPDYFKAIAQ
ncbi:hypothetical protein J0895_13220 [Phormidium pseudopriestleyi FRX01]|uniref:Chemotaxis protein n=1 Tax=Phormidium pseudopriestleyi FRX01 TaxID=1759528 RepID=A0ABS3FSG8_9CYAN|nr:hypothetical protein [Phormidium pseudopriestleyi]MBO0350056.1 hypothetical protein [Phormidium pseudopriestleyi FRX01]